MRHVAPPVRIMALASEKQPGRAKGDLYRSFGLMMAAVATLVTVVAFLVVRRGAALTPSNVVAARWLIGLLGCSTAVLAFVSARLFLKRSAELPARRLRIDQRGLSFEGAPPPVHVHRQPAEPPRAERESLLDFSRPFGVTILGNRARDRLVLAVTSAHRTVYFGARVDPAERHAYRGILSNATTVPDDDAVLDVAGPDGAPFELGLADMSDLLNILLQADRRAFDRCFLSDTHGAPVVLDGAELRIGGQWFDLRSPLLWRAALFQEPFGAVLPASDHDATPSPACGVMVYQATWVQQGVSEAVLVSILGSLASVSGSANAVPLPTGDMPEVASAVLRDLRLMQAAPEPPPPAELRVGIEHTFMLRLRAALDRAPRPSQKDIPSGAAAR
jgi:hypothetical protein